MNTSRPVHTSRKIHTLADRLGVTINPLDTVVVVAWGVARLVDTGTRSPVIKINRKRLVIIDSDGRERAVSPSEVAVLRRDGEVGLEGNKPNADPPVRVVRKEEPELVAERSRGR